MNRSTDRVRADRRQRTPSARAGRQRPPALLLVSVLAGVAGLSLVVSACGGSSGGHVAQLGPTTTASSGTSSTPSAGSAHQDAELASELAFARCMRSHGVQNFPDPGAQGQFPPFQSAVPKQTAAAADDTCKGLLASGGGAGTTQDRQEKLALALAVARCLRSHGFPHFPDPAVSSQGTSQSLSGTGIDPNSPRFQAAETACERRSRP